MNKILRYYTLINIPLSFVLFKLLSKILLLEVIVVITDCCCCSDFDNVLSFLHTSCNKNKLLYNLYKIVNFED